MPVGLSHIQPRLRARFRGTFQYARIAFPAVVHRDSASPADWPLSSKLDESDGMVVFDDVFVPWERVFNYRDPEFCNGLYGHTVAGPHIMQQATIRSLAKAEFMMALAFTAPRAGAPFA
ncbi:MAG: 4-hydroxyphenylacetate 3-hydroxylase N-terminal domain-containing protein [Gammaproteobacteria bacterium]